MEVYNKKVWLNRHGTYVSSGLDYDTLHYHIVWVTNGGLRFTASSYNAKNANALVEGDASKIYGMRDTTAGVLYDMIEEACWKCCE